MKKALIITVSILGVADYFLYTINELTIHSSGIENASIAAMLIIGVAALFFALDIIDKEQKESEKKYREHQLDMEMRKSVLDLLYGDDGSCGGQNLPVKGQQPWKGA